MSHGYLVSREVCEQQPDLINDIFGMAMQFVRQNKSLFFSSSQLESLIQIMLVCIGLTQEDAARGHSEFLIELLRKVDDELSQVGYMPS